MTTEQKASGGPDRGPDLGLGAMMADVLARVTRLVQGELALARAEAAERLNAVRMCVVQGALAVVLGITALDVLAGAAVTGVVALGLPPIWAAALVGGALLLVALGFAQHAARLLRDAGALPRHSTASVKRDLETLQTMVKQNAKT